MMTSATFLLALLGMFLSTCHSQDSNPGTNRLFELLMKSDDIQRQNQPLPQQPSQAMPAYQQEDRQYQQQLQQPQWPQQQQWPQQPQWPQQQQFQPQQRQQFAGWPQQQPQYPQMGRQRSSASQHPNWLMNYLMFDNL